MKKPKERTWDVWGLFIDGDLQVIYQPSFTKKDIMRMRHDRPLAEYEIAKVRVTRL